MTVFIDPGRYRMDEIALHLTHSPLFGTLDEGKLARVRDQAQLIRVERRTLVFAPTVPRDRVFLLISGYVRLYHVTIHGRQVLLALVGPGELFGEDALVAAGERVHFAESMEAATVVVVAAGGIKALMQHDPGLCFRMAELVGQRRMECERRLLSVLFRPIRDRVVFLLLDLAEKFGRPRAEGVEIGLRLSHQDLASAVGSTRETISLTVGELQSEGLIQVERRGITLLDPQRLAGAVDGGVPPAE